MKNLMPEVAALLGVEIGEEFEVAEGCSRESYSPYKITEEGAVDCDGDVREFPLWKLLTGEWTIIKKPWKPKGKEKYYFLCPDDEINWDRFDKDNAYDQAFLHSGNCFRTEREAEANREAIMEKFGWK